MLIKTILHKRLNVLFENRQIADKLYFKTNMIDEASQEAILNITGGGETTKMICDFYLQTKKYQGLDVNFLTKLNQSLKEYNKNALPIKGFDMYNKNNLNYGVFVAREEALKQLKLLPNIAIRNIKADLRVERDSKEMASFQNSAEYLNSMLSQLNNRSPEQKTKVMQKMFKNNTTMQDLSRFIDDKESLLGGADFTKDMVRELAANQDLDIEIIREKGDIMVVKVESAIGIKSIGCNSLWCFTYGNGFDESYRTWSNYSYNGCVYVIIDFRETIDSSEFMHVYIKPLPEDYEVDEDGDNEDSPVFNMSNDNYFDPLYILEMVGDDFRELMNFDEEPEEDEEEDEDEEDVVKFTSSKLVNILTSHKLKVGEEYEIDKGVLNIVRVIPNNDEPKYFIRIGDKQGIVGIDRLLSFLSNYQMFN